MLDNHEKLIALTNQTCQEQGFSSWNWIPLTQPLDTEFYENWLNQGFHGDMSYLRDHLPLKREPQKISAKIRSALVVTQSYFPHPVPQKPLSDLRIALYAQGQDYHFWFKDKLKSLSQKLASEAPDEVFLSFTDSAPILERNLGQKAGLGWIGKNTCLIDPKKGSLFFIGEIYSSLEILEEPKLLHDFCGTCTKCIEVCPTQALIEPRVLNATKCISYLTIESKRNPPPEVRAQIGDWFFGCDLCQTVCPWNQKPIKAHSQLMATNEQNNDLAADLKFILTSSGKQIQKKIIGTPLARAGANGLKRNAIIVIANRQLHEMKNYVTPYVGHAKLDEISRWCLEKLR